MAAAKKSEKYFADAAADLRADFAFRQPLTEANAPWAERIDRCVAVSLHVRRGDYVSDPRTNAANGVCSIDYYHAAVGHIAGRVDAPEFFVFSDDIAWARDNLDIDFTGGTMVTFEFTEPQETADSFSKSWGR